MRQLRPDERDKHLHLSTVVLLSCPPTTVRRLLRWYQHRPEYREVLDDIMISLALMEGLPPLDLWAAGGMIMSRDDSDESLGRFVCYYASRVGHHETIGLERPLIGDIYEEWKEERAHEKMWKTLTNSVN